MLYFVSRVAISLFRDLPVGWNATHRHRQRKMTATKSTSAGKRGKEIMKLYQVCKTAILLSFIVLSTGCSTPSTSDQANTSLKKYTMTFKSASMDTVLEYYSSISGKTIMPHPELSYPVTLRFIDLTKNEVLDAIETILKMNGNSLIVDGNEFIKVITPKPKRLAPHREYTTTPYRIIRIFQLQHIPVSNIEEKIRSRLSDLDLSIPEVDISILHSLTNTILISSDEETMTKIKVIIEELDLPETSK